MPAANKAMNQTVRNAGRPRLFAGAVSAVDIALWDLKARLLEDPASDPAARREPHQRTRVRRWRASRRTTSTEWSVDYASGPRSWTSRE